MLNFRETDENLKCIAHTFFRANIFCVPAFITSNLSSNRHKWKQQRLENKLQSKRLQNKQANNKLKSKQVQHRPSPNKEMSILRCLGHLLAFWNQNKSARI